uniref:DSP-PTPase phosphatase fused to NAD+ Kinase domain-containing protein n=1 Tax=uncultured Nitrospirae bacterium MY2-3C TaxID=798577 RepID=D9MP10_9BACT|nr:hypothetical protein LW2_0240 [uncultured Nitrospirae bacterium MY2-3C]
MEQRNVILRADVVLLYILLLSYISYTMAAGNFHVITQGKAYRSAQLEQRQLQYYINNYGIRSILNLRGQNPRAAWYETEVRFSGLHNIAHYDIALSSAREPTARELNELMRIFAEAPRPILIHCWSGSDRSGLVAAMWKVVVEKEPKAKAHRQLSILYGHLPFGDAAVLDRFFEKWSPAN